MWGWGGGGGSIPDVAQHVASRILNINGDVQRRRTVVGPVVAQLPPQRARGGRGDDGGERRRQVGERSLGRLLAVGAALRSTGVCVCKRVRGWV